MKYLLFGATWCPPCRHMKKLLDELGWEVEFVNVDYNQKKVDQYCIEKIPTTIEFDGQGNENNRFFGITKTKEDLKKIFY